MEWDGHKGLMSALNILQTIRVRKIISLHKSLSFKFAAYSGTYLTYVYLLFPSIHICEIINVKSMGN